MFVGENNNLGFQGYFSRAYTGGTFPRNMNAFLDPSSPCIHRLLRLLRKRFERFYRPKERRLLRKGAGKVLVALKCFVVGTLLPLSEKKIQILCPFSSVVVIFLDRGGEDYSEEKQIPPVAMYALFLFSSRVSGG